MEPPLLRAPDISGDPKLASFGPFLGRMGTNFPIPPSVAARLDVVLADRLKPVAPPAGTAPVLEVCSRTQPGRRGHAPGGQAGTARAPAGPRRPDEFQHVIRLLLDALGYEDVEVTGKSGDRGIDVKAVLRYRGVADVPTFVQAKRYAAGNNVDGATIGRLRGSLPVEAYGIVITTSDFTRQARSEAVEPGLKPIALIDGVGLVELLTDLGIGVSKRQVEVIRPTVAAAAFPVSLLIGHSLRQSNQDRGSSRALTTDDGTRALTRRTRAP